MLRAAHFFLHRFRYELFAAAGTVIVLWQMLLPGYVLTLDMVFGPAAAMPSLEGIAAAGFPVSYLIYALQFALSGWIVEKALLLSLFFLLFYLPLRCYPFRNENGEAYFAALIFAINPFVYERFLAGHWRILFAYALLFPLASCLARFYRERSWSAILSAAAWLVGIGLFSLHLFVMGVVVVALFTLAGTVQMLSQGGYESLRHFMTRIVAMALIVGAVSLYWIIPAIVNANVVGTFTPAHWKAFKTASDPFLGTIGNVAALYGFWGEHEMLSTYFVWPKDGVLLWWFSGAMLAAILLCGLWRGSRDRSTRFAAFWLIGIGILSLIFSAGIGDNVFAPFNLWLFEHIPFWQGFRDSQKWSAVLTLTYALFCGIGAGYVLQKIAKARLRVLVLALLCTVPLLYTPNLLFGFNRQLQPVWYPATWAEANEILKDDPACKAIFLPWHLYYALSFNHDLITANTAPHFFDCEIISGNGAELGGIESRGIYGADYDALEVAVTQNDPMKNESALETLRAQSITHVIFTDDLAGRDIFYYPFLVNHGLERIYEGAVDNEAIMLFKL